MAKMTPGEFEVGHRHSRDPVLFGHVSSVGLENLGRYPTVESVQYKVESAVHSKLEESPKEFVCVVVVLRNSVWDDQKLEEFERAVKRIQDPVLAELKPSDSRLVYQSSLDLDLWGWASIAGLEKLAKHPAVLTIGAAR